MKSKLTLIKYAVTSLILFPVWGCKLTKTPAKTASITVPASYNSTSDTTNTAVINWRKYFTDANLTALIDTALKHNQELNMVMQEIEIARNEARAKKGEYLPSGDLLLGGAADKSGKYTWNGQSEEAWKAANARPEYIGDFEMGAFFSWELDVWKKLRNGKKAAVARYLGSIEGKNFTVTRLVAEIANLYYELEALDNQLAIVQKSIEIQTEALKGIQQQKENAMVTQLAVNRFEAQLLNTKNRQYQIQQRITETENELNFLAGRFPQPIKRSSDTFNSIILDSIYAGVPAQLLANRPDIRRAELELMACQLDVRSARANFYPSLKIQAGTGFQAFNPAFLINPESMIYSLAGELMAPLINRNAIKAAYNSARAKQVQAVYNYEQTILKAYTEVLNQLTRNSAFARSYATKSKEVELLNKSVSISDNLFRSARADYIEVLLTQREALESKMELIEIQMKQMQGKVATYEALGGGWK